MRPELTKTNTQYQRECSASGGEKIATDYGPISHKWINGFFERLEMRHHIKMNECHAEMLGVNRAEVARENQDEFRGLAHKLGVDTVAGRTRQHRRIWIFWDKSYQRMTSEKVINHAKLCEKQTN